MNTSESEAGATPKACGVREGARYLGVSPSTVRALIRSGALPARMFGQRYLVQYADLDALYESLPEAD